MLDGTDLAGRSVDAVARAGVAIVPQGRRVFSTHRPAAPAAGRAARRCDTMDQRRSWTSFPGWGSGLVMLVGRGGPVAVVSRAARRSPDEAPGIAAGAGRELRRRTRGVRLIARLRVWAALVALRGGRIAVRPRVRSTRRRPGRGSPGGTRVRWRLCHPQLKPMTV